MAATVRIGISGWRYAPWRGTFYPEDLAQRRELDYASRQVRTVEINGTFYSLQRPESFEAWYRETPDDFVFAVKGGQYLTHRLRLEDPARPLANFFASGVLLLREKLGPFLWQLPPSFKFNAERLEAFFTTLPRDTSAALELCRRTGGLLRDEPALPRRLPRHRLRHALEVRHESFLTPDFVALLRRHRIGLVVADTAGKWPFMEDLTADFVYVRLHGDEELYVSGYTPPALDRWAEKIRAWQAGHNPTAATLTARPTAPRRSGRDVFVYFDNDVKVCAPFDAMSLAHRLGLGPAPGPRPDPRTIKEAPRVRAQGFGTKFRRRPSP